LFVEITLHSKELKLKKVKKKERKKERKKEEELLLFVG
jgi:hypothetical protein